jgi:hypothetical protein
MVMGCKQHEHVLDRYHVNRKLKERLYFTAPALQDEIRQALRAYRWEPLQVLLDTAEAQAETPEEIGHVQKLRQYVARNWISLAPLKVRKIPVSASGMGACESNHRIYSYRMKKQGRHWSRAGGTAMVKVITGHTEPGIRSGICGMDPGFYRSGEPYVSRNDETSHAKDPLSNACRDSSRTHLQCESVQQCYGKISKKLLNACIFVTKRSR